MLWNGVDLSKDPDALCETFGYLPQDFGVCPQLSALEFPEYIAAAAWLADALVMLVAGAPALLRLSLAGEPPTILGWLLAAAFVPALALACGVWTGGNR